jgi:hypothetical protein
MNSKRLMIVGAAALALLFWTAPVYAAGPPKTFEELVSVDNGVRQVSSALSPTMLPPEGGGGGTCWGKELERSEGAWPYAHRLFLYTVWCGSGGQITYRASDARTSHDFMCWNTSGPHVAKLAGGAGWTLVQVQAWVDVACHSPWWFDWHDSLMMRVNYYPNGVYQTVAWD